MRWPAVFGARHFGDYGLLGRLESVIDECRSRGDKRLPSESELCRRLEVERVVLHRLLQTLGRDGVLAFVRGKGWFLPEQKLDIPVARYNSYTANMVQQKKTPHSELLGIDQTQAGSSDFWQNDSMWLWVLDFRRYDGLVAFSLARVHIPVALTPGLNRLVGRDISLYRILEQEFGIRPQRHRSWCEAVAADTIVADALEVTVGEPLLRVTNEAEWNGLPFEQTVNYLRGYRCRIKMDLSGIIEEKLL